MINKWRFISMWILSAAILLTFGMCKIVKAETPEQLYNSAYKGTKLITTEHSKEYRYSFLVENVIVRLSRQIFISKGKPLFPGKGIDSAGFFVKTESYRISSVMLFWMENAESSINMNISDVSYSTGGLVVEYISKDCAEIDECSFWQKFTKDVKIIALGNYLKVSKNPIIIEKEIIAGFLDKIEDFQSGKVK